MIFFNNLETNPKQIFLIDALGALLTAILLFGVLTQLEQYIGMPRKVLYVLAGIAFFLFVYSISCYGFIKSNWKPFLKIIIFCNILYSMISIGFVSLNYEKLTKLGVMYFIIELAIIGIIITVEYKSYRNKE